MTQTSDEGERSNDIDRARLREADEAIRGIYAMFKRADAPPITPRQYQLEILSHIAIYGAKYLNEGE